MTLLIIVLVALSVAGVIGWVVWSSNRELARLHEIPRTAIRDLVPGAKARVIGTARSVGHDVAGHFTGKVCLACHARISTTGDGISQPEDRVVAFTVEDETGSIEIAVANVRLELRGERVDMKGAFGASIIDRESAALGAGATTYYEDRLPVDGRVAVTGYVVTNDSGARRLTGKPGDKLVIANLTVAFIE